MYLCPESHLNDIYTNNSRHMTHYLLAHVKNANKKPVPTKGDSKIAIFIVTVIA